MTVDFILIGTELLIGQVVDTNSVWLGQELSKLGISVHSKHIVSDDANEIVQAIEQSLHTVDGLIITGGLGPTNDDITKKVLAEYFGASSYREDEKSLQIIAQLLTRRNILLTPLNRLQASVPDNCEVLLNHYGTAPGMLFQKNNKFVMSLPGVPSEVKGIMQEQGIPWIIAHFDLPAVVHQTVLIQGIAESILAEKIAIWEANLPAYMHLAYLPNPEGVRLRISALVPKQQMSQIDLTTEVLKRFETLSGLLGDAYMGLEFLQLEESIAYHLKKEGQTVAVAESCTAGGIAAALCSIPGASAYFKGGIIAYSNEVKMNQLGVLSDSLLEHGAVSLEVVMQMATGVRLLMNTDYGIATSGIAGPQGGSEDKPVGTVWIAISTRKACFTKMYVFGKDRTHNIQRFIASALKEFRFHLVHNSPSSAKLL